LAVTQDVAADLDTGRYAFQLTALVEDTDARAFQFRTFELEAYAASFHVVDLALTLVVSAFHVVCGITATELREYQVLFFVTETGVYEFQAVALDADTKTRDAHATGFWLASVVGVFQVLDLLVVTVVVVSHAVDACFGTSLQVFQDVLPDTGVAYSDCQEDDTLRLAATRVFHPAETLLDEVDTSVFQATALLTATPWKDSHAVATLLDELVASVSQATASLDVTRPMTFQVVDWLTVTPVSSVYVTWTCPAPPTAPVPPCPPPEPAPPPGAPPVNPLP